jgi:hypothetical protein
MFRYHAGEKVAGGFYVNRRTWGIAVIDREGVLEGEAGDRYGRIPALVALVLAPIAGAAFAMFLPFLGIAMVLDLGARKMWRRLRVLLPVGARGAEPKMRG